MDFILLGRTLEDIFKHHAVCYISFAHRKSKLQVARDHSITLWDAKFNYAKLEYPSGNLVYFDLGDITAIET